MKNKTNLIFLGLLIAGCGDVDTSKLDPVELDVAVQKLKLCQEISDEQKALEIARYSEGTIDRKSKFPCTHSTDLWTPKLHSYMKELGFAFKNFKARNYKPSSGQQRLEIIFSYEDSTGLNKKLSYSCEMNNKMKEWTAKESSPEC